MSWDKLHLRLWLTLAMAVPGRLEPDQI